MRLWKSLALLALASRVLGGTGSYNAFLGCVISGSGNVPATTTATGVTRAQCQSKCRTAQVVGALGSLTAAQISFWSAAQGNCYCGLTMALSGAAASTTNTNTLYHQGDAYGNCLNGQDLAADYLTSNLRFEGCSSSALPSPQYSGTVTSPEKCIDYCYSGLTTSYMTSTTIPSGVQYACNCYSLASTALAQTRSNSGPSAYNIYSTGQPSASMAQRKRSELLKAEKRLRGNTPCPRPLDACLVQGSEDYECLDTTNELESCGGCLQGHFQSNRPAGGVNCATIEGVASDGVMCTNNQCVVSRCRYGWKLVKGKCEQLKTRHVAGRNSTILY